MGVAMLGLGAFAKIQTSRLDAVKAEYAAFVLKVKVLGEEAERKAKAKETADIKLKERTDAETKRLRTVNSDLSIKLRDERARSDRLSQATAASDSAGRACYGAAELERAIQRLDEGVSGLIAEGSKAIGDLNVARLWATDLSR